MKANLVVLPGDGIGPEVTAEAIKVMTAAGVENIRSELGSIPLFDATADSVLKKSIQKIGLLGTSFTMEKDFYRGRLENLHNLEVIIPQKKQRDMIHDVIYEELVQGKIRKQSRAYYQDVIAALIENGAEGIILGCTEIPLLLANDLSASDLINPAQLLAEAAVQQTLD